MLFNSLTYLTFLTLTVGVYWFIPARWRMGLVLLASLFFYGFWRVEFLLLICFSAFVDYYFSLKIHDETRLIRRRYLLCISLAINLGLLVYFKYTYFLAENAVRLGAIFGQSWEFALPDIILPLGISFYTFLSISYTVDVYRRTFEPIRHFGVYLTYVMFWPHMIAGPILRAHELIPQVARLGLPRMDEMMAGLRYVLMGLFLKVALGDQLAPWVDEAFAADPRHLGGLDVWTMAYAFGLQIYFDFAGYSMIAIGSALLIGVQLPENFNWPYLATSPRDFWRRWHITLSSWIRDYLYLPLTGATFQGTSGGGIDVLKSERQLTFWRMNIALFLTWFTMGLWHGAAWKFAFWGVWHATVIFLYRIAAPYFAGWRGWSKSLAGWFVTMPIMMLGWVPFRAASLDAALMMMSKVLDLGSYRSLAFRENFYLLSFVLMLGMLLSGLAVHARVGLLKAPSVRWWGQHAVLAVVFFAVFIFLRPVSQFIYFQF
ncbi:MAG: MBOAT family O-acyltransferase [Aquabacterium sp.]